MKTLLVIFGITGDLSTRKLLPALSRIIDEKSAGELEIMGVSRRDFDVEELVLGVTQNKALAQVASAFTMDMAEPADYARLRKAVHEKAADQTLIYLSVPPSASAQIVDLIGEAGLNNPSIRLLFEKPFGFDTESARDYIGRTARYFKEEQLYRIDHYMAKEIAAQLLKLRRNAEHEHHHWGAESVTAVRVVASEKIGIEGRAQFYEQTGALRDFIQGHLLQLLSLVLITRPTLDASLATQRLKALEQLQVANPDLAVRGQYDTYQAEVENPGSVTETYAALRLESDDPNWTGVPLLLVTGKALDAKRSYIEVRYKDGRIDTFEEGRTVIEDEDHQPLEAYQRVLLQAIAGEKELFTSSEEVVRSWEIVAPVQYAWGMDSQPLKAYPSGASFDSLFSA